MNRYLDIRLRPDPEFSAALLMGALYGKLHRTLFDLHSADIGVSFPKHGLKPRTIGDVLRLHGNTESLQRMMARNWLNGMRDHAIIGEMLPVPEAVQYRIVSRRQFKTNVERLRRRRAKRHGETLEQARAQIPDSVERTVQLPFIQLNSRSTAQRFCLFIEHGELRHTAAEGTFNQYGLSNNATVPWF
ncbi:type I-F CRISPR-associated endoribonuclease Cas6/Csy4 [Halotalea alkalilenta]|uniref:type I-F CRISPR-associated endoribonuclease Cas6/Csy4 n=1 Tax=Halotalea alkalilenta TaxID=376489 RepID=UPI0004830400|nr:type I-F CRISPR-associated endoribonuclease Cas6/Csy4 [Halotalea alkalilenta]